MSESTSTGRRDDFASLFGRPPAVEADAPGRVNLIGEHTDYNGGWVLPVAIPQRTTARLAPSGDALVRVWSAGARPPAAQYRLGEESPRGFWLDYVMGVTSVLRAEGFEIGGFDLRLASSVPMGAGLSSSAALELSLLRALRACFRLPLDDVRLAVLGQRAEVDFVGARVGIMDQMAASLADERTALRLDAATLAYEKVPLPAGCELAVLDSGVKHSHAGGGYNERRLECERAAAALDVELLARLDPDDPRLARLPPPLDRRARHVASENARVRLAVEAMRSGRLGELGRLLYASHESLRRDFEVSCPELDRLVEWAAGDADVLGARMTGGGFGGCAVVLARAGTARAAAARLSSAYASAFGRPAGVVLPL